MMSFWPTNCLSRIINPETEWHIDKGQLKIKRGWKEHKNRMKSIKWREGTSSSPGL